MNNEAYKKTLDEELETLTQELSALGSQDPETGIWEADPEDINPNDPNNNEMADRFEDFEERSSKLSTLKERYEEITSALKKIEDDSYGTCQTCGSQIEEDRLSANPAAKTCKAHM